MKNKKVLFIILAIVLVVIAVVALTLGGKKGSTSGELPVKEDEEKSEKRYLVDGVEIGDYVDIGIEYQNMQDFESNQYSTTSSNLTGWRVLGKSGSGETGTVTLVSAGCPITFYHSSLESAASINKLKDLYKGITIDEISAGFREVGFESNNLQTVFSGNEFIDLSKGIRPLGSSSNTDSVLTAYFAITGKTITMEEMYKENAFGTEILKEVAGDKWKENYTDLLANGQDYWIGDETPNSSRMWRITYGGRIVEGAMATYGIRPVVSLLSGVTITSGDGTSSDTAYNITK